MVASPRAIALSAKGDPSAGARRKIFHHNYQRSLRPLAGWLAGWLAMASGAFFMKGPPTKPRFFPDEFQQRGPPLPRGLIARREATIYL